MEPPVPEPDARDALLTNGAAEGSDPLRSGTGAEHPLLPA